MQQFIKGSLSGEGSIKNSDFDNDDSSSKNMATESNSLSENMRNNSSHVSSSNNITTQEVFLVAADEVNADRNYKYITSYSHIEILPDLPPTDSSAPKVV